MTHHGFPVLAFLQPAREDPIAAGELCMPLVYPKAAKDSIPGHILKAIRKEIEDGHS